MRTKEDTENQQRSNEERWPSTRSSYIPTPTTPTTPKSCCKNCKPGVYTLTGKCRRTYCPCHSNSTQEYGQPEHKGNGDTIGSLENLAKVMAAPQHTSQGSFQNANTANLPHTSWKSDPIPIPPFPDGTYKVSFTDKTLAEFREKYRPLFTNPYITTKYAFRTIEQWLSSKLEEAQNTRGIEGYEKGAQREQERILSLIERMKEMATGTPIFLTGFDAALTALTEEITK